MRTSRLLLLVTAAAAVLAGALQLSAQSTCRGQCDESFRDCQRACVDAQSYDQCVDGCRTAYQACLADCD